MSAETIKSFLSSLEWKNFEKAASCLSDNFAFSGPVPQPLNKSETMAFVQALITAIPNLAFHLQATQVQDDKGSATIQITGTHSGELALPGRPPIPATEAEISLPEEHLEFTFLDDDTISAITTDSGPRGDVAALLQQLGRE